MEELQKIRQLLDQAEELGMQFGRDNSGQIVLYTNVVHGDDPRRRGPVAYGLRLLTDEDVEKMDG